MVLSLLLACVSDPGTPTSGVDPSTGDTPDTSTGDTDTSTGDTDSPAMDPVDGMAAVPGGAFEMGCTVDADCYPDEEPAREVRVSSFYIDVSEVSQRQWRDCVDAGACTEPSCNYLYSEGVEDYPVVCVTPSQAAAYCAWRGKRLPTEAEWEKAARGTEAPRYPWGDEAPSCDRANFMDCGNTMMDVGGRPHGASPYGALDMAGNVGEWVADWYGADTYADGPDVDPTGPSTGDTNVWRGGNCEEDAFNQRAWGRHPQQVRPGFEYELAGVGVRCAMGVGAG